MSTPVIARAPTVLPTQATVVVQMPADASLFIDGQQANLTSTTRTFYTPELKTGQEYGYTLRAEATRNGQTVEASKKVTFRAGQTVRVDFGDLREARAMKTDGEPAKIKVKLPAKAQLYVDDKLVPTTAEQQTFETPKLVPGRNYTYTLRAELTLNGQKRTDSKQVVFQAGKEVSVDFSGLGSVRTASR